MENFQPKNGDQVWIHVFTNWSSGTYIGLDVDRINHLVREPKEAGFNILKSTEILPITENPNGIYKPTMQKVKAIEDEDGHWFVLPESLYDSFYKDLGDEDFIDSGGFDTKYGQYMTGGDLNLVQLYAEV